MQDNILKRTQIVIPDGSSEQEKQRLLKDGFNNMYSNMFLDLFSSPDAPIKERKLFLKFLNSIGVKEGEPLNQQQRIYFDKWLMQQNIDSSLSQEDSQLNKRRIFSKILLMLTKFKSFFHIRNTDYATKSNRDRTLPKKYFTEPPNVDSVSNNTTIYAPIGRILPSFIPVFFEKVIPGYESVSLIQNEIRLSRESLGAILIASGFVGALTHAIEVGFDFDKVKDLLQDSTHNIPGVTPRETELALELVNRFISFNIIRESHTLDDWLCEAIWSVFQKMPYTFPSAMSTVVAHGVGIRSSLLKCTLRY